ncbi:DUF2512 family protein [Halobacillus mangrovi]|uniref:DUF2512 family protein n=1 Tax=Halobacillus mangrovi TaxID=402384 RepID=UPI003D99619E
MKAISIKGIFTIGSLYLVLSLGYEVSLISVILLSILLGSLSYLAGDRLLLPKTNNVTATAADIGLTFLVVWISSALFFTTDGSILLASTISAIILGVLEYSFHLYLVSLILPANNRVKYSY